MKPADFGAGQSPRRVEDGRFLRGMGRYAGDLELAREAHGCVLRSPHAHARLAAVDTRAAAAMPGVLAVLTGADVATDGLGDLPCMDPVVGRDGRPCFVPPSPLLTRDRVRHVGDRVAFVVAESLARARDAAERIAVDYEPLPAVADAVGALHAGTPQLWDAAPGNLCVDWAMGDEVAVAAAFARADHVTHVSLVNNRLVAASMEPRGAIGEYDPGTGRYTLHAGCQGVHNLQRWIAGPVLRVPPGDLRVLCPDVGGGFGMKAALHAELALVLWAARRIGRPVKWMSDRGEAFVSDAQARDQVSEAALALDARGRMLGMRVSTVANMGAYVSTFGPAVPTVDGSPMLPGVYRIPSAHVEVKCVFTNTVPVDAYRGAGRPEAAYVIERLVDAAAREIGMDPAELRRRNLIAADDFPHRTVTGHTYDSGDYARTLDAGLVGADRAGFEARRHEAAARSRLRGFGMAYYVERCGVGGSETARMRFDASGALTLLVGTQSNGQGHETAYAQIAAALLSIPFESVRVVQGDTDAIGYGRGTGGSRSLQICGPAIQLAAAKVVAKAKRIAGHMLEAAEADIDFADGRFTVRGTDRSVTFGAVAARALEPAALPPGIEPGLDEQAHYAQEGYTFPNGCHVAEVEIDPETGTVDLVRYSSVDDFGTVLNPMLTAGQVHGSLAQGIGQARLEGCVYDPESGQLLTGSFTEYCLPRADDLPNFECVTEGTPSPANPMGVKGCAEAGCVGAPPALVNAVVDALAAHGVRHIDMPLTPERVWAAIRAPR